MDSDQQNVPPQSWERPPVSPEAHITGEYDNGDVSLRISSRMLLALAEARGLVGGMIEELLHEAGNKLAERSREQARASWVEDRVREAKEARTAYKLEYTYTDHRFWQTLYDRSFTRL